MTIMINHVYLFQIFTTKNQKRESTPEKRNETVDLYLTEPYQET